jgi:hypothetical protein
MDQMKNIPTQNVKPIMKEIERKTTEKVMHYNEKSFVSNNHSITVLKSIMEQGANEFKQKTGRPMTYSEMREMFG